MATHVLMHKDIPVANLEIDTASGKITKYQERNKEYAPFLGNCDLAKINRWWSMRAVPVHRELMQQVIRSAGCQTSLDYLEKNLALSVTDTYWVRPAELDLKYADVSFSKIAVHNKGIVPYHNISSYDPNASLGGQMDKYWDLSHDVPILVKESYRHYGQQSLNEVMASYFHAAQQTDVPYVQYIAEHTEDGGIACKCESFTSDTVEFVSAYEVLESAKIRNDQNNYQAYIDIVARHGVDRDVMQKYMDYQTMSDFAISNTDEHLQNFGVLRNSDTMQIIGPAPIFDSGNSMFYAEKCEKPYTRVEFLERQITSFYKTEEKLLTNVQDPKVINTDLLLDPVLIRDFFANAGIPEHKASVIASNYQTKIRMIEEMQRGKQISLYAEKQEEKARSRGDEEWER